MSASEICYMKYLFVLAQLRASSVHEFETSFFCWGWDCS